MATQVDVLIRRLNKLQTTLLTSGLQQSNPPLYQVINQLIASILQLAAGTIEVTTGGGGGGGGGLANQHYVTSENDQAQLPNSRQLLAGSGITLDDSVWGELTVSINGNGGYWSPLTDGDPDETDLIFANGEPIMVFVPEP